MKMLPAHARFPIRASPSGEGANATHATHRPGARASTPSRARGGETRTFQAPTRRRHSAISYAAPRSPPARRLATTARRRDADGRRETKTDTWMFRPSRRRLVRWMTAGDAARSSGRRCVVGWTVASANSNLGPTGTDAASGRVALEAELGAAKERVRELEWRLEKSRKAHDRTKADLDETRRGVVVLQKLRANEKAEMRRAHRRELDDLVVSFERRRAERAPKAAEKLERAGTSPGARTRTLARPRWSGGIGIGAGVWCDGTRTRTRATRRRISSATWKSFRGRRRVAPSRGGVSEGGGERCDTRVAVTAFPWTRAERRGSGERSSVAHEEVPGILDFRQATGIIHEKERAESPTARISSFGRCEVRRARSLIGRARARARISLLPIGLVSTPSLRARIPNARRGARTRAASAMTPAGQLSSGAVRPPRARGGGLVVRPPTVPRVVVLDLNHMWVRVSSGRQDARVVPLVRRVAARAGRRAKVTRASRAIISRRRSGRRVRRERGRPDRRARVSPR